MSPTLALVTFATLIILTLTSSLTVIFTDDMLTPKFGLYFPDTSAVFVIIPVPMTCTVMFKLTVSLTPKPSKCHSTVSLFMVILLDVEFDVEFMYFNLGSNISCTFTDSCDISPLFSNVIVYVI
ncbi:hypothetical protein MBFIL_09080 [Methanobrevibacter filiformis]|uniref:Uncharacterized protein n=1 Tax=Methanobrevibacter filiformis TaxID=55758 RepID=A0A166C7P4_9EURY|nr:hypothetical protein MBFIL_09080 [Methanobrevibacter filiformis]